MITKQRLRKIVCILRVHCALGCINLKGNPNFIMPNIKLNVKIEFFGILNKNKYRKWNDQRQNHKQKYGQKQFFLVNNWVLTFFRKTPREKTKTGISDKVIAKIESGVVSTKHMLINEIQMSL